VLHKSSTGHLQALYYGAASTPLVCIVPDAIYHGMWRMLWPDGRVSDLANLSRIKEAALVLCERGPPRRDAPRLHWKINPLLSRSGGRPRAQSVGPGPKTIPALAAKANSVSTPALTLYGGRS
jgi:hypothetical protein